MFALMISLPGEMKTVFVSLHLVSKAGELLVKVSLNPSDTSSSSSLSSSYGRSRVGSFEIFLTIA